MVVDVVWVGFFFFILIGMKSVDWFKCYYDFCGVLFVIERGIFVWFCRWVFGWWCKGVINDYNFKYVFFFFVLINFGELIFMFWFVVCYYKVMCECLNVEIRYGDWF